MAIYSRLNLYDLRRDLNIDNDLIKTNSLGSEFHNLGALEKKEFDHCEDIKHLLGLTWMGWERRE